METSEIKLRITYCHEYELDPDEKRLINEAKIACTRSYAPYSSFHVGAAVLLNDGTIISGSNQENASYPNGLCAERVAVFYANSNYPQKTIVALAIVARDTNGFTEYPISPCGSCRQVLLESEQRGQQNIRVILYGTQKIVVFSHCKDLLPLSFDKSAFSL